jgi:hypothetical protein
VTAGRSQPVAPSGRASFAVALAIVGMLAADFLPTILAEGTRDWIAYAQAADRLAVGELLYIWELATPDDEYYLYPPPAAAIWGLGLDPQLLLLLKLASLAVGMAALAGAAAVPRGSRVGGVAAASATAFFVLALLFAPNIHDLVLGNVMVFYVAALAASVARPGWAGAVGIGLVGAIVLKPLLGPYLLWLLLRRRADFAKAFIVGAATSLGFALLMGSGRYVEYLQSLPEVRALAVTFTGNLGTITISPLAAVVGVVAAYALTGMAAARLPILGGSAVAVGAMLFAQPTIGFNYAGVLMIGVVALWAHDRRLGIWVATAGGCALLLSPLLAAAVLVIGGFATGAPRVARLAAAPGVVA